jgi:hypothetical protein
MISIRPEARAALWRWRETLIAGGLGLLALRWLALPGLLFWLGCVTGVLALVLAVVGVQRARFRIGSGGPGVVQITEGQITYLGPLTGGAVALSELERIVLDPTARPAHWVLVQPGQPDLAIPVTAEGADALFDAFSALPGLNSQRMVTRLRDPGPHSVVIWERQPLRPDGLLHS